MSRRSRWAAGAQGAGVEDLLSAGGEAQDEGGATRRRGFPGRKLGTGDAAAQATWTGGNALASRAASALVVAGLLTGPAALLVVAAGGAGAQAPTATGVPVDVLRPEAAVVGQRAEAWVRTWLSTPRGREEDLAGFWTGRVQLPEVARQVVSTSVADVRDLGGGRWSVQVAAVVLESAGPDEDAREVTSFFQVPVAIESAPEDASTSPGDVVRVLALPAPVAGRQGSGEPAQGYGDGLAPDSPVASVVTPFLQALVTGQGDVAPYLQPGARVAALQVPAAAELQVRSIAPASRDRAVLEDEQPRDGAVVRVLAQVELVDASGQVLASEYPLTLTARAGRWEITSLDPAPVAPVGSAAPTEPSVPSTAPG